MAERGRTLSDIISQYLLSVRPMHYLYTYPSREFADLQFSYSELESELDAITGTVCARILRFLDLGSLTGERQG